jgi:hypothetical protein
VREDGPFELLQRATRLKPELLREAMSPRAICVERTGLLACPVQRDHQLPEQPLAERVLPHKPLELAD